MNTSETTVHAADSRYAMLRLGLTLLVMTVGSSGMYVVSVMRRRCRPSSASHAPTPRCPTRC